MNNKQNDDCGLATEYAGYYTIAPQGDNESNLSFRERVAGGLRDQGELILAHEAYQNARWDESADVVTGITGALAQVMRGKNYGSKGNRQIGDDLAVGYLVENPKPDNDPMMAMLAMLLFGGK